MKAIILNYDMASVDVAYIPNNLVEDEDGYTDYGKLETYLVEQFGYSIDSINYMCADDDEPIPIYKAGSDETTDEPLYTIR